MVNQGNDADDFPKLGAMALLKAADFAAQYSNVLYDEDPEDEEPIQYWANHANLLRKLADEWSAPEDGWKDGNVVPFVPRTVKFQALPPERGRRES
jgi:hypothetical protein